MAKRERPAQEVFVLSSAGREDILKDIEGEKVFPNHVGAEGHLVAWYTTPEELDRVAEEFVKEARKAGDHLYVSSSGYSLALIRPGRDRDGYDYERGVFVQSRIAHILGEARITVSPLVLQRAARKLAQAPWESNETQYYAADSRVVKFRTGDDIITVVWTPPTDRQGRIQVTPMQWAAWSAKKVKQHVAGVKKSQMTRRSRRSPNFSGRPVNTTAW